MLLLGGCRMEPGCLENPGKHCLTEVEILGYGTYQVPVKVALACCVVLSSLYFVCLLQGMEVTKVLMLPRTGRRHQLRVHSLCLGHPIVGDFTYNPVQRIAVRLRGEQDIGSAVCAEDGKSNERMPLTVSKRMMLHAHNLKYGCNV
jgi:hypothetical protein